MINQSKSVILFIRVFIVLLIVGFLLPVIFNELLIRGKKANRDNCLYVITQDKGGNCFYDGFLRFLEK